jgi:anti-sigma factor RsiW
MSCSSDDLKAYVVGEMTRQERGIVDDHVRGCQSCREELDRLNLTQAALVSLEDEEIPRRIAFVSDRVFEPRWWQTMWRSGPVMGFASSALLAAAILVHGFESRPIAVATGADAGLTKQISELQAQRAADIAKFDEQLKATEVRFEHQRQEDLATVQQAAEYYQKQVARFEMASNEAYKQ